MSKLDNLSCKHVCGIKNGDDPVSDRECFVVAQQPGQLHAAQDYHPRSSIYEVRQSRHQVFLARTLREAVGAGKLVRAGPKDWDIPLEIRIYCSSETRRPAAKGLWKFLQQAV